MRSIGDAARAGDGDNRVKSTMSDASDERLMAFEYGVCAPECGAGVARSMAEGGTRGVVRSMTDDAGVAGGRGGRGGLKPSTLSSESSSGTGDRRRPRARSTLEAVVGGVGGAVERRRGGDADRGGAARRVSGVRTRARRAAACSGDMACSGASKRTGTAGGGGLEQLHQPRWCAFACRAEATALPASSPPHVDSL